MSLGRIVAEELGCFLRHTFRGAVADGGADSPENERLRRLPGMRALTVVEPDQGIAGRQAPRLDASIANLERQIAADAATKRDPDNGGEIDVFD